MPIFEIIGVSAIVAAFAFVVFPLAGVQIWLALGERRDRAQARGSQTAPSSKASSGLHAA